MLVGKRAHSQDQIIAQGGRTWVDAQSAQVGRECGERELARTKEQPGNFGSRPDNPVDCFGRLRPEPSDRLELG